MLEQPSRHARPRPQTDAPGNSGVCIKLGHEIQQENLKQRTAAAGFEFSATAAVPTCGLCARRLLWLGRRIHEAQHEENQSRIQTTAGTAAVAGLPCTRTCRESAGESAGEQTAVPGRTQPFYLDHDRVNQPAASGPVKVSDWLGVRIAVLLPHPMGSLKKRRKAKINKHKRRKKLRLNRHKKRTWQK